MSESETDGYSGESGESAGRPVEYVTSKSLAVGFETMADRLGSLTLELRTAQGRLDVREGRLRTARHDLAFLAMELDRLGRAVALHTEGASAKAAQPLSGAVLAIRNLQGRAQQMANAARGISHQSTGPGMPMPSLVSAGEPFPEAKQCVLGAVGRTRGKSGVGLKTKTRTKRRRRALIKAKRPRSRR